MRLYRLCCIFIRRHSFVFLVVVWQPIYFISTTLVTYNLLNMHIYLIGDHTRFNHGCTDSQRWRRERVRGNPSRNGNERFNKFANGVSLCNVYTYRTSKISNVQKYHQPCKRYSYKKIKEDRTDNNKIICELINVLGILCWGHLHGENALHHF